MRHVLKGVLPALVLLLSGCGSGITYVPTDNTMTLSAKPSNYEMPMMAGTPARQHKQIGEMSVTMAIRPTYRETSTYDQCMDKMKTEAGKHGADAVVAIKTLDSQKEASQGRLTVVGTLIIYTAPEALATSNPVNR